MVSIGLDSNPKGQYVVYSAPGCPYCVAAKELLDRLDIPHQTFTLGIHYTKETLREKCGLSPVDRLTVPQIFANNIRIGGYDDLCRYLENKQGGFGDNFR